MLRKRGMNRMVTAMVSIAVAFVVVVVAIEGNLQVGVAEWL